MLAHRFLARLDSAGLVPAVTLQLNTRFPEFNRIFEKFTEQKSSTHLN